MNRVSSALRRNVAAVPKDDAWKSEKETKSDVMDLPFLIAPWLGGGWRDCGGCHLGCFVDAGMQHPGHCETDISRE